MEAVRRGGERLKGIVDDLLEVARIESKDLYLGSERIEMMPLMEEVELRFRTIFAERDLKFHVGQGMPSIALFGDPDYLKKAIFRLVENAVKFTPAGGRIEVGFKS